MRAAPVCLAAATVGEGFKPSPTFVSKSRPADGRGSGYSLVPLSLRVRAL